MSTKYQMQARSSVDGRLYSWLRIVPDWGGSLFPGPGVAQDVALACAPFGVGAILGGISAAVAAIVSGPTASWSASTVQSSYLPKYLEFLGWAAPGQLANLTRQRFAANTLG